jgi:hypothetical protein
MSQNCQKSLFCIVFSIKTDMKVLQLLNGLRKSKRHFFLVGYMLPYDPPEAIFSLSHVQNFLGFFRPPSNPPNRREHIPKQAK